MPGSESHLPTRKPRGIAHDAGLLTSLHGFWQQDYAREYIGLVLLLLAYLLIQFFAEPFHRLFYLHDPRIQYPHSENERVPVSWLFGYAGGIPLAILIVWAAVVQPDLHKAHMVLLGFINSIILTLFITDVLKNAIGRPRPDLLDRCRPSSDTPNDQLLTVDVCSQTNQHILHDGWRSFPSGHSSFAFSGLGYLGIFIASQLQVCRPRADLARVLLTLAPFLGAALIAISRLEDYRHDVFDVVVGSLLGASVAYVTWRRHFPPLSSPGCTEPYAAPESIGIFGRARDEEEIIGDDPEYELSDGEERYPFVGQRP